MIASAVYSQSCIDSLLFKTVIDSAISSIREIPIEDTNPISAAFKKDLIGAFMTKEVSYYEKGFCEIGGMLVPQDTILRYSVMDFWHAHDTYLFSYIIAELKSGEYVFMNLNPQKESNAVCLGKGKTNYFEDVFYNIAPFHKGHIGANYISLIKFTDKVEPISNEILTDISLGTINIFAILEELITKPRFLDSCRE